MKHPMRQITGGPFYVRDGNDEVELTVDLHWVFREGERGSLSVPDHWELDKLQAYDEAGKDWVLTPEQIEDAVDQYGLH